ncbi:hypothetical protein SESBI_47713 [Sesbania bispinosa]|nr:hypothetical protein SESBI_47713 [Sesbania bispinosa]
MYCLVYALFGGTREIERREDGWSPSRAGEDSWSPSTDRSVVQMEYSSRDPPSMPDSFTVLVFSYGRSLLPRSCCSVLVAADRRRGRRNNHTECGAARNNIWGRG